MSTLPAHLHATRQTAGASATASGAVLFAAIWEALADLLGTSTTAVLMRRAARRTAGDHPELGELEIAVAQLEYRYAVPRAWMAASDEPPRALQALIGELLPLLVEMTGRIAIRRLEQIPELRGRGLLSSAAEDSA